MSKTFRAYDMNQRLLLPPDIREWLRPDHLALYVSDLVEELDLSKILSAYEEGDLRGRPPYHPAMMVKILIYGYCVGRMSSRKIEQATYDDVAFRVLACDQHPDHDSIADFRKRHLKALGELFVQVLHLCQLAGLVKLGHVAIDGTKLKANASLRKSMTYERMSKVEKELEAKVTRLLEEAQRIDEEEDGKYGKGNRGDELPEELRNTDTRRAKIRALKENLERETKETAEREMAQKEEQKAAKARGEEVKKSGSKRKWTTTETGEVVPKPKVQRNLTDSDSRIMKDSATGVFVQGYNGQIAVDSEAQIIVATNVVQAGNDGEQLVPLLNQVEENVGRMPDAVTADTGYFSEAAVTDESLKPVDLFVPPNKKTLSEVSQQMRDKLRRPAGIETYKKRSATVEPVFADIKHVRRFRQFTMRGLAQVHGEWSLICLTHNLLKMFRAKHPQLA